MEEPEEKKVAVAQKDASTIPYKQKIEISEEAKQNRQLLIGMIFQQTKELTQADKLRKKKRKEEIIELQSGVRISVKEIHEAITANLQPYIPMFPNTVPFFSEMFRLLGWKDRDPNVYFKPSIVGSWIIEIIYNRFSKDVVHTLRELNPASPYGIRAHKHSQYLTEEGRAKLVQYRDEAIAIMKTCSTWYEFRKELFKKHGVPYQIDAFGE